MKNCEICGRELRFEGGTYKCQGCGGEWTEDDLDPEKSHISAPTWGEIKIDLSSFHSRWPEVFGKVKERWEDFEQGTSQGLFEGQFKSMKSPQATFTAYGTRSTYLHIRELLGEMHAPNDAIQFSELPFEEIDRIRDLTNSRHSKHNRA